MTSRTIQLTTEQVELARMTVEADRAVGRPTDRLIARIAEIGREPITLDATDLDDSGESAAAGHRPVEHPAR